MVSEQEKMLGRPNVVESSAIPNPDVQFMYTQEFPKAFGVKNPLKKNPPPYIGVIQAKRELSKGNGHGPSIETTHWYADRRRKKGTIAGRKNND